MIWWVIRRFIICNTRPYHFSNPPTPFMNIPVVVVTSILVIILAIYHQPYHLYRPLWPRHPSHPPHRCRLTSYRIVPEWWLGTLKQFLCPKIMMWFQGITIVFNDMEWRCYHLPLEMKYECVGYTYNMYNVYMYIIYIKIDQDKFLYFDATI